MPHFTEATEARKEARNEDKSKPPMSKKTLFRRSLREKPVKASIAAEAQPTKPASPGASTHRSLEYCSEYSREGMRKPPSQLRERHTEESLFPNLIFPVARGDPAIAPIKPHPTSIGYIHYLADIVPGDTDASGDESKGVQTRSRNQKFLPPIDPIHKGDGGQAGTVTFNSVNLVDPSMPGVLEYLDLNYRSGSRNVSRSIFWSKTINRSTQLHHSLKNSGIDGNTPAAGGRVSRILKKVLVSMENNKP